MIKDHCRNKKINIPLTYPKSLHGQIEYLGGILAEIHRTENEQRDIIHQELARKY
jgi:hypothetical protein